MEEFRKSAAMGCALALLFGVATAKTAQSKPPSSAQGDLTGLDFRLMRDYRIGSNRVGIVAKDWLYCYPPTGELILVPAGYMTDFASIPDPVKPFIDVFGDNAEAAVAHDWLYAVGEPGLRQKADELIRFAVKEQGVGLITRNAIYLGVRAGGGAAYGRPGEWDRRFGDPVAGRSLPASPYQRRKSAFVGKVKSCGEMESIVVLLKLRAQYGSSTWPRVGAKPP